MHSLEKMPSIIDILVAQAVAKRAMLLEEWLTAHNECWPGPQIARSDEPFVRCAKCSCGVQLEITLLITPVVNSYIPRYVDKI